MAIAKNTVSFSSAANGLAKNVNQLYKQPGITLVGFAANPEKNLFKIGLVINHKQVTNVNLHQAIQSYLKSAASFTVEADPNKLFKPYQLQIEEIDRGTNTTKLLAIKPAGSNEIAWK